MFLFYLSETTGDGYVYDLLIDVKMMSSIIIMVDPTYIKDVIKMEIALKNIPKDYKEDIERAIHILKRHGCTEIYLFGSVAEGNVSGDSDIDIAVRGCRPEKFFYLYGQLMLELKHPVDLINLDRRDNFSRYLERRGGLVLVS